MRRCPFCNADVSNEEETECGVFCPKCGNDFWMSEALDDEPHKWTLSELRTWGGRA